MNNLKAHIIIIFLLTFIIYGCKNEKIENNSNIPSIKIAPITKLPDGISIPENMVWIPGGIFTQGAQPDDTMAMRHEKPAHKVIVDGFFMSTTEVTNSQFSEFVNATNYTTTAERPIDWEELKKQVPKGTLKPHDSLLQPGSLIFKNNPDELFNPEHYLQWWKWKLGANWRHPYGSESTILGKENQPVVHVSYEDAVAYCKWTGERLPTEAEWEYAAKGGNDTQIFSWGTNFNKLVSQANTWQGSFPNNNTIEDGFEKKAPVASYPPNKYGLYDMAGNVWEWTQDWYHIKYYKELKTQITYNPPGTTTKTKEKVIKGGSYLCSENYCANFRISARMATNYDSSFEHLGFRTVLSLKDLKKKN